VALSFGGLVSKLPRSCWSTWVEVAPVGCGSTMAFFAGGLASFSVPLGFGLLSLLCVWAAIGPQSGEGIQGPRSRVTGGLWSGGFCLSM
jgi:hypothetical protein